MRILIVAAGAIALSLAASSARSDDGLLNWLDNHSIKIRKSFTGSAKDSMAPASFGYENPDSGDTFVRADVGIKTPAIWEFDPAGPSQHAMRLVPTVEYHRSTKDGDKTNKQASSLTFEYEYGSDREFSLVTDTKFEISHDSLLHETSRATSLRIGFVGDHAPWPGVWFRTGERATEFFKYYLSTGFEQYDKLPIKEKQNGENVIVAPNIDTSFTFLRANALILPWPESLLRHLALTLTYTQRWRLDNEPVVSKRNHLFEASIDYFFDDKQRIGLGLSYQQGEDPTRNFLDEESSSFGLKVKFGD